MKGDGNLSTRLTGGDFIPPRHLAVMAAAISAHLEAEVTGRASEAGDVGLRPTRGPWSDHPGGVAGLGWAAVGRLENMLGRQQLATRRGTSPR